MADGMEVRLDVRELERIISQNAGHLDQWLREHAEEMVSDVKLSFGTGPSGRTYQRGNRVHVASAVPGPPAVDTGLLRASIRQERVGELHYRVVDGVEYGIYLEEGTEAMGARPFMAPAMDERRRVILRETNERTILP